MLNTIHLRTFLAVVESGNYSQAAERLHMSQPAVSQHIRSLEQQLDEARLFRRVGQQMLPTHAGEQLLEVAREMLALAQRAEEDIKAMRGQVSGRVVVGCTPTSGEHLLPALLAGFRTRFPAISVEVALAPLETLLEWLSSQQIHLLLCEEQQRKRGWEAQLLGSEPVVLLGPRGHVLLQQEQVAPGQIKGLPLVLPRRGGPLRRVIDDGLRRRGIGNAEIEVAIETDSTVMMVEAVRGGVGIAFVPQSCVPRGRDTAIINIAGLNLQLDWHLVRSRERGAPRAVQELFGFITSKDSRRTLTKGGLKTPTDG